MLPYGMGKYEDMGQPMKDLRMWIDASKNVEDYVATPLEALKAWDVALLPFL